MIALGGEPAARRLPPVLRRRRAEQRRVESFVAAIRATAPQPATPAPLPVVAVERVDTPTGPVWQLDAATRGRLRQRTDTVALPLDLVRLMVQP